MIDLGVLLRVPCVEVEMGFDISPDGRRVAFSWNPDGSWEIYEISLRSSPGSRTGLGESAPRLVSCGPGAKFHPRYSPDGRFLAYVVDFDGSENFHILLHDFATMKQTDLTPDITSALQACFVWSPDGRQIAFISDQSGRFDVYTLSVADGEMHQVLDVDYPAWKVCWSPDGRWLAVTVEASGIDYGTFIVPAQGGEAQRIADENGPIDSGQASWSPDSRYLAYSSDTHGYNNIGIYEMATRHIAWLSEGEGEKQFPAWSPDGTSLAYVFNRGTVSWLAVQKPGQSPQIYQVEPGVHYIPRFTPDGDRIILSFDNPRHPPDLWSFLLEDEKFTQLTHSLPEELAEVPFVMPEEIAYPGMDGTPIPALLFRPQVQKSGPAVVLVHGGPDWFFEMTWYPLMVHMASRGWVVLVPNYRGSTGYGRTWQEASRFDFGGVDTDDVAAGAFYLQRENLADPKRIAVTGRSHGGYLTASCLTRYPELWAVGSAFVPFLNWFTNHTEIRPDLQQWDIENFGDPVENHDLWQERSPSFFLDRIRVPLQLICGRHDARCPISDSIQAYEALKQMGKEAELVVYEDEGHAFLKMENILDSEMHRVEFLAKHLETDRPGEN
jgi:dipeptidyl aminopeptidase/acylaminoacyl peptidase